MGTAAHCNLETVGTGKGHRIGDVRRAAAADDHGRTPVDESVVDATRLFVADITGPYHLACEALCELRRPLRQSRCSVHGRLHVAAGPAPSRAGV